MRRCSHCCRDGLLALFGQELHNTMQRLWTNRFFAIARNGGCEQTLRNHFLLRAQEITGCTAFTESSGRADLVLRCPHCESHWARMEFKSNFAVQHRRIADRQQEAVHQLRQGKEPCRHRVYVHLITELTTSDPDSPMAAEQRAGFPGTNYKWFRHGRWAQLAHEGMLAVLAKEEAWISGKAIHAGHDRNATAALWAWAYLVPRSGAVQTRCFPSS